MALVCCFQASKNVLLSSLYTKTLYLVSLATNKYIKYCNVVFIVITRASVFLKEICMLVGLIFSMASFILILIHNVCF